MNVHPNSEINVLGRCWVVIPAYNEAATIREVATRTIRQIKNVIIVHDGSTDGRAEAPDWVTPRSIAKPHELWEGRQPVAWLSAGIDSWGLWHRDLGR